MHRLGVPDRSDARAAAHSLSGPPPGGACHPPNQRGRGGMSRSHSASSAVSTRARTSTSQPRSMSSTRYLGGRGGRSSLADGGRDEVPPSQVAVATSSRSPDRPSRVPRRRRARRTRGRPPWRTGTDPRPRPPRSRNGPSAGDDAYPTCGPSLLACWTPSSRTTRSSTATNASAGSHAPSSPTSTASTPPLHRTTMSTNSSWTSTRMRSRSTS